ncbi:hypothetical protein IFO69_10500 [Echinicola sp. CAU 1574]|uniref:Uncharacterized protein n=1 Tax=Echinicola arenosa TaxID=2774144 RepID=A0ABR9AKD6_9BACT|nr:hypothetical protein [Echinicola arenosa]MBD8489175.1 hypothetical protein [Echinicola arenosa]
MSIAGEFGLRIEFGNEALQMPMIYGARLEIRTSGGSGLAATRQIQQFNNHSVQHAHSQTFPHPHIKAIPKLGQSYIKAKVKLGQSWV